MKDEVKRPTDFKKDEIIIVKRGDYCELARIKSVVCGGAYVYTDEHVTKVTRVDVENMFHIGNSEVITQCTLGRRSNWRDEPATEKQIAYIKALRDYCTYTLPYINYAIATKGEASDYIEKYASMAHESAYGLENESLYGDRD
jgi:hypothetical protein